MQHITAREGITTYYGSKKGDNSISISTFYEQGNFTDRDADKYDLERGVPVAMDMGVDNNSQVKSTFFDIGASFGNLSLRTIIDRYRLNSPWPDSQMYKMRFFSDIFEAKYKMPVTENLVTTTKFVYKHQKPWNYPSTYDAYWVDTYINKVTSNKFTGEFNFSYNMGEENNITAGMIFDDLTVKDDDGSGSLESGKNKASYSNKAIYAEGHFHTPLGNLTVGGRHVKHNRFGSNFVPRFALTNEFGSYHTKAIYAEAYRNPDPMNIGYNSDIKPEKTKSYEFEIGKQLSEHMLLTANVFDVEISDPIVYSNYSYSNFEKTASQGIESTLKYKKGTTDIALSYSFYRVKENKVTEYDVPGHSDELLGLPSHKLSLYASISPFKDFFITPSATYYSHRYAITNYDGSKYSYTKTNPKVLTDISFLFKNAFKKEDLDISFSVHNILNEKFDYIQTYRGNYGPMPGPSRAFTLKLTYKF
jgi:outer membrane cobalamin receptor